MSNPLAKYPYAVHCPQHGKMLLSQSSYAEQLKYGDAPWSCPECGAEASWDDEHHESWMLGPWAQ